jgi:hypothetical protein
MNNDFKRLFSLLTPVQPSFDLENLIVSHIRNRAAKARRLRVGFFVSLDVVSLVSLIWLTVYVGNLIGQSGFYNYLALVWLDSSYLSAIWYDLLSSLVESLPVVGLAGFLSVLAVFFLSSIKTFKNFIKV